MEKRCPSCGIENRDLARFCQKCRYPLEIICPSCRTSNGHKSNFCSICGYAFPGGSQPLSQQPVGLQPGTILDRRYKIEKRIGGGGMGSVYQATDMRLGNYWAIKEMSDAALTDPAERQQAIQAFENEARLLAKLDHNNLPKVNNHFEENGKYYLVMDFIDGETLEAIIDSKIASSSTGVKGALFAEAQVLKWAAELCDVLTYLHNQNPPVIFRDLKPGNIMIEKSGRVRLIDFGVARLFKPGKSKDTSSFGTKGFAPPEQYGKGQTDARSDVYALGATLHFLLTMHDPSDDPFHFQPITEINPDVSRSTSIAIARAVNFERVDRWPTMAAFLAALKETSPAPSNRGVSVTQVTPLAGLAASTAAQATSSAKQFKSAGIRQSQKTMAPSSNACTQCGTYLTNLDVNCPNCGTPRPSAGSPAGNNLTSINICRKCGTRMTNLDTRCPSCGAARESASSVRQYKPPSTSGSQSTYPVQADTPHGRIWLGWGLALMAILTGFGGRDALIFAFLAEVLLLFLALNLMLHDSHTANRHGKFLLISDFILFVIIVMIASS